MAASKRRKSNTKSKKRGKNKKKDLDENSYYVSGISDGAMKRLARRGGIKRISADVYEELRKIYIVFLEKLVEDSYSYADCAKRKTIIPLDVVYALKRQGRNLYGYVHDHEVGGKLGVKHDGDSDE
uniref:Histone H4 n=1 Tax=Euplotes vannus TaxID=5939 RepID=Q6A1P4_EUPVA|nr:histone H4 [Euplotes vannus]